MADITIKDIAARLGVSYATVSRALNGKPGVGDATRNRVLQLAKKMGYRPNDIARSLVTKQSHTIALILADIANPFFADIAKAAIAAAYKRGYYVLLSDTDWNTELERKQVAIMQEKRVDGIILKPADERKADFSEIRTPFVLINHLFADNAKSVELDNELGGKLAGEHLARCGYRRIGFVGGAHHSTTNMARLSGLKKALESCDLPIDDSLFFFGNYSTQYGYEAASRFMQAAHPPDAVFCANDMIALGVWQYMQTHSVAVPSQFGIVGFDDIFVSSLPQIQLTTVAQSRQQIGELAVHLMIDQIENGGCRYKQAQLLQPILKIRNSTRPI